MEHIEWKRSFSWKLAATAALLTCTSLMIWSLFENSRWQHFLSALNFFVLLCIILYFSKKANHKL